MENVPTEIITSQIVQLGAIGLFLWHLWKRNEALQTELRDARQHHHKETAELRAEIDAERAKGREREDELRAQLSAANRAQLKERGEFQQYLWRISKGFESIAEHIGTPDQGNPGHRQDDRGMGVDAGQRRVEAGSTTDLDSGGKR
jgi:hypothetical protein